MVNEKQKPICSQKVNRKISEHTTIENHQIEKEVNKRESKKQGN